MHAAQHVNRVSDAEAAAERGAAGFNYAFGGLALGAVAIMLLAVLDGLLIAFAQKLLFVDPCGAGFSTPVIVVLTALGVSISIGLGMQLYRWGRWIGYKSDPEDQEYAHYLRRRFRQGAMTVYCVLVPATWIVLLGAANCVGGT